jgi:hypothetical protein
MGVSIMNLLIGAGTLTNGSANIDNVAGAVPVGKYRLVKAITLCNKTATDCWVTLRFNGINILNKYVVPGFGDREENTITIPFVDQVMDAGHRITGLAETSASIDFYISGVELDVV